MSVEKLSDLSKTILESVPFAQISNFVIEHIKDNDAYRIWSFCFSKSRNWKVMKEFTQKVCGVGERKGEYVWSYLKRCGLIDYERIVDKETGKFIRTDIKVLNGTRFNSDEPFIVLKPTPAKTADMEKTTPALSAAAVSAAAEMTPLLNKEVQNKEKQNKEKSFCKKSLKEQNEKKPDWATPKPSGFSDPTKQSTSYRPPTEDIKVDTTTENYQAFIRSNPALRRKYKLQGAGINGGGENTIGA